MGFKFNPLTGELDLVGKQSGQTIEIITHFCSPFGQQILFFDPQLNAYYSADDLIVTDNEGNVVTT